MTKKILSVVLLVAGLAFAQGAPATIGKATRIGHVDGGTLPTPCIGCVVYDTVAQQFFGTDGGSWVAIGGGGSVTSSTEFTAQSATPAYDGGSAVQLFAHAIGPCGVPFWISPAGKPELLASGPGMGRWLGSIAGLNTAGGNFSPSGQFAAVGTGSRVGVTFSLGGSYHQTLNWGAQGTTGGAANNQAGIRGNNPVLVFRGMDDGGTYVSGGFLVNLRGGIGSTDSDQRFFFGLYGTNADLTAAADPSAATNTIYVGCDAADTNLSICSNDASGTATCATLGANFPCKATGYYDFWFCSPPAASSVGYYVRRLDSRTFPEAAGTLSSDLPATSVLLYPTITANSGPTGATTAVEYDSYLFILNLQ